MVDRQIYVDSIELQKTTKPKINTFKLPGGDLTSKVSFYNDEYNREWKNKEKPINRRFKNDPLGKSMRKINSRTKNIPQSDQIKTFAKNGNNKNLEFTNKAQKLLDFLDSDNIPLDMPDSYSRDKVYESSLNKTDNLKKNLRKRLDSLKNNLEYDIYGPS